MRLGHHSITSGGVMGGPLGVTSGRDLSDTNRRQVVRGAIIILAVALARRK
jgi:hypothetical protein